MFRSQHLFETVFEDRRSQRNSRRSQAFSGVGQSDFADLCELVDPRRGNVTGHRFNPFSPFDSGFGPGFHGGGLSEHARLNPSHYPATRRHYHPFNTTPSRNGTRRNVQNAVTSRFNIGYSPRSTMLPRPCLQAVALRRLDIHSSAFNADDFILPVVAPRMRRTRGALTPRDHDLDDSDEFDIVNPSDFDSCQSRDHVHGNRSLRSLARRCSRCGAEFELEDGIEVEHEFVEEYRACQPHCCRIGRMDSPRSYERARSHAGRR